MTSALKINWDLLAKYLSDELSNSEHEELQKWMNQNESNRLYLLKLEDWWNKVEDVIVYGKIDVQKDWKTIKSRIEDSETLPQYENTARVRYFNLTRIAVAVVLLLLVSTGIWVYNNRFQNEKIEPVYVEFSAPNGQRSQIKLSDGTSVWLNSGSTLYFPVNFDKDKRSVKLQGEAYFEVKKSTSKPFEVQTNSVCVKVYGTSFNVMSYLNDNLDVVTLMNGSLGVFDPNSSREIILTPKQKVVFDRKKKLLSEPKEAKLEIVSAWQEGKLVFEDEPLEDIIRKMERHYGAKINLQRKEIGKQRYRGILREGTLDQALKAIQLSAKFNYRMEKDTVMIY